MRSIKTVLLAACVVLSGARVSGSEIPDAGNYDPHDFSGVWNKPGGGRYAQVDVEALKSRPVRVHSSWAAGELPFTDAGWEAYSARKPIDGPRQVQSQLGSNDPRDRGNPLGLYRAIDFTGTARYFEMVQTGDKIVQMFSLDRAWRSIYMDGRPVPEYHPAGPFWYGHSVGHWEDNTLVVDTVSLDERAWLDDWGTAISMDARVEERWERTGRDEIVFTMTIYDPTYYTEPWSTLPLVFARTDDGVEPFEIITAPIDAGVYIDQIMSPAAENAAD